MAKLQQPLDLGWTRECVTRKSGATVGRVDIYYFSPGGKKFRSGKEIENWLKQNPSSGLASNNFTFNGTVVLRNCDGQVKRHARGREKSNKRKITESRTKQRKPPTKKRKLNLSDSIPTPKKNDKGKEKIDEENSLDDFEEINRSVSETESLPIKTAISTRKSPRGRVVRYFNPDISMGKEQVPISCINEVNLLTPSPFEYISKTIYAPNIKGLVKKRTSQSCICTKCSTDCECVAKTCEGGELSRVFTKTGRLYQGCENTDYIYECGPCCACDEDCGNKMVQNGLRCNLQVFMTKGRGWGVRCLDELLPNTFVAEYIGEVLSWNDAQKEGVEFGDEYLLDLDWQLTLDKLKNKNKKKKQTKQQPYVINAKHTGGVARFFNHSCGPNMYLRAVFANGHSDTRFPNMCLFTTDRIPAGTELTWNYGLPAGVQPSKCTCGAKHCIDNKRK